MLEQESVWDKVKNLGVRFKRELVVVGGLVLVSSVVIVGVIVWPESGGTDVEPPGRGATPVLEEVVTTVGSEPITITDVEDAQEVLYDLTEEEVVTQLSWESQVLQAAQDEGLITLPEGFFTAEVGAFPRSKRIEFLNQAKSTYEDRLALTSEGGVVTVFFYNFELDRSGFDSLEEAEQVAYDKTLEAYNRVQSGEDVVDVILDLRDDPVVQELDWNAENNTGVPIRAGEPMYRAMPFLAQREAAMAVVENAHGKWVSPITRYPGTKEEYPLSFFEDRDADPNREPYGALDSAFYFFVVLSEKPEGYMQSYNKWTMSVTEKE